MINQVIIVGTVEKLPELSKTQNGTTVAKMVVKADRNFRNEDGTLSNDFFQITLWRGIAEECADVCKVGSLVGIKGRLLSNCYEKNDFTFYNCEIIAEKVSFLSERMEVARD